MVGVLGKYVVAQMVLGRENKWKIFPETEKNIKQWLKGNMNVLPSDFLHNNTFFLLITLRNKCQWYNMAEVDSARLVKMWRIFYLWKVGWEFINIFSGQNKNKWAFK